ncbi:fosfomycin resistance glutathione transferase [Pseudoalteromonas luteoviolacea]|uniref:fosfomycin resistance glutathione transferase n=1 Tax=Pseudoalteromonas luteoviolacea TaxID=43657 RepID=UPI001B3660F6|nr:fosfomycin resistance glutathione transferase [Pseudoalteromonas luteoviolacea]MBQ4835942.1 fosfomycin resistance glutathione transferase [Pseudoalteromonas luteoviolacea]
MITGINHITLSVLNLTRSIEFYQNLGAKAHVRWQSGAYLSFGELWLCLSICEQPSSKFNAHEDYTHIALNIEPENFVEYQQKVERLDIQHWQQNRSEGESLYILDPDGHKLEVHVGSMQSRLNSLKANPYNELVWYEEH